MKIELVPVQLDLDFTERLGKSTGPRTQGVLHISQIYGDLMSFLQPKRFDKSKPFDTNKVETGLIFETMLEEGLAEKFATVRPGEIVSDEGIYMSPDGVNPTEGCGEEFKCTWMSSRVYGSNTTPYTDEYGMPTPKFVHWFIQMKGYAKWLQMDTFLLRVLHINGDYEHPYSPQFLTHRIVFTDIEIEENWTMLVNHARRRGMLK